MKRMGIAAPLCCFIALLSIWSSYQRLTSGALAGIDQAEREGRIMAMVAIPAILLVFAVFFSVRSWKRSDQTDHSK